MPEAVCLLLQYSGKCQHSTLRRLLFDCVLTETKKNREKPAKKKFVRGKKDSSLFFFCLVSYAVVHKCHTDQQFLCICAIALPVCVCSPLVTQQLSFTSLSAPSGPLSLSLVFSVTWSSHHPSLPFSPSHTALKALF